MLSSTTIFVLFAAVSHSFAKPIAVALQRRQGTVITEFLVNDPNNPTDGTPMSTWTSYPSGPDPTNSPQPGSGVQQSNPPESSPPSNGGGGNCGAQDTSPLSDGVSLLTTINKWRGIYSLPCLQWDDKLANDAASTGQQDGGDPDALAHHNPQGNAEVLSGGSDNDHGQNLQGLSPFEVAYMAWICEVQDPRLTIDGKDYCAIGQQISASYVPAGEDQTGHQKILTDSSYTRIGCAFTTNTNPQPWFGLQGIWGCDLTW